jgi:hypothetical protein
MDKVQKNNFTDYNASSLETFRLHIQMLVKLSSVKFYEVLLELHGDRQTAKLIGELLQLLVANAPRMRRAGKCPLLL